jgi:branched-chain amino acid transport system permease protein
MPDFKPFLVIGLALGGVYAMSGVGLVVLYRTTGVLNLFYGAVGALASLTAWELINEYGWNQYLAFIVAIVAGGSHHLRVRLVLRTTARRSRSAREGRGVARSGADPARLHAVVLDCGCPLVGAADVEVAVRQGWLRINVTQALGIVFPDRDRRHHRRLPPTHQGRDRDAGTRDNRDNAALLGIPVRKVEAFAWFGSGILFGVSGCCSPAWCRWRSPRSPSPCRSPRSPRH